MIESRVAAANPEDFAAAAVESYIFPGDADHERAMAEALDVIRLEAHSGQGFSALHMNREARDEPVIIRLNSYHSSSTTRQQKYTTYQFAAAHPEHQVIAIDLPSHGRSDRPPLRQYADIIGRQSMRSVAEAQATAIVEYIPTEQKFILLGDSVGGELAPSVALSLAELGRAPQMVLGFDPTGMHGPIERDQPKTGGRRPGFAGHDAYHQGESNRALDNAYSDFSPELDAYGYDDVEYDSHILWKHDPLIAAAIITKGVRQKHAGDGFEQLEIALAELPDLEIAIMSGGLSRICHWKTLEPEVKRLRQAYGSRFTWDVWPNDSHSVGIAEQQPRMVAFTRSQIDSRLASS